MKTIAIGLLLTLAGVGPAPAQETRAARTSAAGATVTVLFYGDVTSPRAAQAAVVLRALMERHPNQVAVEFHHHYPANVEAQSRIGDLAIAAAAAQGCEWDMVQLVVGNQDRHSPADAVGMARQLQLDVPLFEMAVQSGDVALQVAADASNSARLKLPPEVALVIGEETIAQPTLDLLEARLAKALESAR